jgi:hypothetical protein
VITDTSIDRLSAATSRASAEIRWRSLSLWRIAFFQLHHIAAYQLPRWNLLELPIALHLYLHR